MSRRERYAELPPEKDGYYRVRVPAGKFYGKWHDEHWVYKLKMGSGHTGESKSEEQPKKKLRGLAALPKWRRVEIARSGAAARFKRKESVLNATTNQQWVPVYFSESTIEPSGWLDITSGKFITRREVTPGMTGVLRDDLKLIGKPSAVQAPSTNGDHEPPAKKQRKGRTWRNRGLIYEVIDALKQAPEDGLSPGQVADIIVKRGTFTYSPVGKVPFTHSVGTTMASSSRNKKFGILRVSHGRYRLNT